MKKKAPQLKSVVNRRARFDYELGDEFVVGIILTGPEVRAVRDGRAQLKGAFVTIRDGELYLNGASLSVKTNDPGNAATVQDGPRKLLAHQKEIDKLKAAKQTGLTIVPTKILTTKRYIKVVIALAKGKKNYDKRQVLKKRQQERDTKSF